MFLEGEWVGVVADAAEMVADGDGVVAFTSIFEEHAARFLGHGGIVRLLV